jgi:diketogulonate reductase-like aldo/keto reductase
MGLGVAGADCYAMVKEALKIGYRHIDTVQIFSIRNPSLILNIDSQASNYGIPFAAVPVC